MPHTIQDIITIPLIKAFEKKLVMEEKSTLTISKYLRDITAFYHFLPQDKRFNKDQVISYKDYLIRCYSCKSVNSMLTAVNQFLLFLNRSDCRVRLLKIQRQIFCDRSRELSRTEYLRLLAAAKQKKNRRLYMLVETICSTGIRVSELPYITVQSAKAGRACVSCKGKTRVILIPKKLCSSLLQYAREKQIQKGSIFITKHGTTLDRSNIWSDMKSLCKAAQVAPSKVFPHNLRHLFARTFYNIDKDITRLADILGHSSIDTTRIYIVSTGREHEKQLSSMRLVI